MEPPTCRQTRRTVLQLELEAATHTYYKHASDSDGDADSSNDESLHDHLFEGMSVFLNPQLTNIHSGHI